MVLSKFKKTYQKILLLVLCSLVVFGIGVGIAFLISSKNNYYFQDVTFIGGVAMLVLGLLLSKLGGTSSINMRGVSPDPAQIVSRQYLDAKQAEQTAAGVEKNVRSDALFSFNAVNISILSAGAMMVVCGLFIFW